MKVKSFFRRPTWKCSDYIALTVTLMLLFRYLAWWAVDVREYIDVQSVVLTPTVQGLPIEMEVIRLIHQDFEGGYRVEIRDAESLSICSTGNVQLGYKFGAKLKEPLYLSYWAGGGSCQGRIPSDLKVGLHNVRTCHFVTAPYGILPSKERCTDSIVEILPKEGTS